MSIPEALQDLPAVRRFSPTVLCSGHPTEAQLEACAREGVEVVINLCLHGQDYSLPDESGLLRRLGVEYIHIPVVWDAPTREDVARFFEAMHATAGRSTLVHCVKNMRATAFLALFAIHQGGDREHWLWWIRETWEPDEYPAWAGLLEQCLAA
ncbi:MAG: protein tyrosine phosphatase family protein [Desulfovibrio sp.]|nr:protein tyrosine phosphatase family protein [Desulfovibrio sp.]